MKNVKIRYETESIKYINVLFKKVSVFAISKHSIKCYIKYHFSSRKESLRVMVEFKSSQTCVLFEQNINAVLHM